LTSANCTEYISENEASVTTGKQYIVKYITQKLNNTTH